MTTSADVAIDRLEEAVVAHLIGEVDMTNTAYVGDELMRSVPNDVPALVLDLAETRYIDSAAIELLFDMSRRLQRRRQELRLVLPAGSPLKRVLMLTDIQSAVPLHETLEEALAEA
jgi:anti-sigma B factor antagonist